MSKRNLLKLPDDFEGNIRALLGTKPPPAGTPGSRKVAKRKRRTTFPTTTVAQAKAVSKRKARKKR